MPVLVQPKKVSNSTKLFLVIFEVLLEGKDQVRQKAFQDFLRQIMLYPCIERKLTLEL